MKWYPSVLFRVRVCMLPSFESTPLSQVCKVNTARFLCITGQTWLLDKYPFTRDFGNTNVVPPTPEWERAGVKPWSFREMNTSTFIFPLFGIFTGIFLKAHMLSC